MFNTGDQTLNAKALKMRVTAKIKELRDENSRFSSALFLVTSNQGNPSLETLNEKLLRECEHFAEKIPSVVLSEATVLEKNKLKDALKSWKTSLIVCVLHERMGKQQAAGAIELLAAGNKLLQLQFDDEDKADAFVKEFLEARLCLFSLLLDISPALRTDRFAAIASKNASVDLGQARRPSVAAEALVSNDDSLLLKSAFLMYQRVGLSHDIAQNYRHHDYEKTVSSSLQKLEAQRKKKLELTERLNAMEADVARRKQEFEAVTRRLNEIFGNVLSSVETVHKSLLGTHNVLRSKYAEVAARVPLRDEDRSLALNFSLALGFCNAGLVVDGPLKRQLEDLELRESQGASELAELEDKLKRLQSESDNLKGTKAEMEVVVNSAASLKDNLLGAAQLAKKGLSTDAEIKKLVSVYGAAAVSNEVEFVKGLSATLDKANLVSIADDGEAEDLAPNTPHKIVDSVLRGGSRQLEASLLRTFEYYLRPIMLLEHLIMAYTEGPAPNASHADAQLLEKRMVPVRLRCLNFLRKWIRIHPYHFEDERMRKLLNDFLACAKVTGNEGFVEQIEQDELNLSNTGASIGGGNKQIASLIPKFGVKNIMSINDVSPEELARQITLVDFQIYSKIQTKELLKCAFTKNHSPNIRLFSDRFNKISSVVVSHVLASPSSVEVRNVALNMWIRTLSHLRLLHNYQSLLAIVLALSSSPVSRLKANWASVDSDLIAFFDDCRSLMDKNFSKLRQEMTAAPLPGVPYIGGWNKKPRKEKQFLKQQQGYQRDLVYLDENATFRGDKSINVQKFTAISDVIENCLRFQDRGYVWLSDNPSIQGLIDRFPVLSDDEAHQNSLTFEPKRGTIVAESDAAVGGVSKLRRSSLVQKNSPLLSLETNSAVAATGGAATIVAPAIVAPTIVVPDLRSSGVVVINSGEEESPRSRSASSSPRRRKKSISQEKPPEELKQKEEPVSAVKDSLSVDLRSSSTGPSPRLKRVSLRKKKPLGEEEAEGEQK